MKGRRIRRPGPAMVVAVVALVFAATGAATATVGRHSPAAQAAKKHKVANEDAHDLSLVRKFFSAHRGELKGPKGDTGAAGATGAPGAAGANGHDGAAGAPATKLWAVINGNGFPNPTVIRGSGVTGVTRPRDGQFVITFAQPVNNCAYSVTTRQSVPEIASAEGFDDSPSSSVTSANQIEVFIVTSDGSLTTADVAFSVEVFC